MPSFLTLDQIDVAHKTVLLRLDLNIPMENQCVSDDTRIVRALPTLTELLKRQAKVVVLSHFGRPEGKPNFNLSLFPVAEILQSYLSCPLLFASDCIGAAAEIGVANASYGEVVFLENLRFHPEEEKNDPKFAKQLASLGDIYVNDAFSCSHRAHASIVGICDNLPAVAGRAMEAELNALQSLLTTAARPIMAIVGGSKVSTKLELLANLVTKIDILVLGGGMANTFLLAQGKDVGNSLVEPDLVKAAQDRMALAEKNKCRLILPEDYASPTSPPEGPLTIMDIGPQTIQTIKSAIDTCQTVVWNGPVGVFEVPPFETGSVALATAIAQKTQAGKLVSIAGGGDTLACLNKAQVGDKFTYTSTAGGAFLEWLEGKRLPGVAALTTTTRK
jgi:phosphoglycerate kinase